MQNVLSKRITTWTLLLLGAQVSGCALLPSFPQAKSAPPPVAEPQKAPEPVFDAVASENNLLVQGTSQECYVKIKGMKQGAFRGESTREAHKDDIPALGYSYEVKAPRDVATGQSSGKRQHAPIVITKEWGASSPQLFQALVTNEVLTSVELMFVKTGTDGVEQVECTVKLTNACVSDLRQTSGEANPQGLVGAGTREQVSFVFEKIELSNAAGKTIAMDDWSAK